MKRTLTPEEVTDRAEERWFSMTELESELTLHKVTIYRLINRGALPVGTTILGNRKVWFDRDVRALKRDLCAQPA